MTKSAPSTRKFDPQKLMAELKGGSGGEPSDAGRIDRILADDEARRRAADRPQFVRAYDPLFGSTRYYEQPPAAEPQRPVRPPVLPGHKPNRMSARERRAQRDTAAAAQKKPKRVPKQRGR